jgi:hypothetical protein
MKKSLQTSFLLALAALVLSAPGAQGAKPGGVAVLLPSFVPVPAPEPFLYPVSPFDITGFMQTATVDNPGDVFSAGYMEINGIKIRVPRNTVFQMPATAMTWQEMFSNAPQAYKNLNQSGLALLDGSPAAGVPAPFATYEVHVQGNRVINNGSDQYIAGLVFISQQSINSGQGFINCIDYNKMEIWLSAALQKAAPCTGTRLRINTPNGRYGLPDPNEDLRFGADEDNPTISARTGYPMCLPRIDPAVGADSLCPSWNRPRDSFTGAFSTIFSMGAAVAGPVDKFGITHQAGYPNPTLMLVKPDPFEQAPFEVGDYITWMGTLVQDGVCSPSQPVSSCQYVSANTMTDELGIFTAPNSFPVYVTMSEFRLGVGGIPNPLFPQEAVEKIFGDAFTTDNTQLMDLYGVDVNPTNGTRTHRFFMSADPFGPPLGGLKGRGRFRSVIGNFLPATREMAVSSRSYTKGANPDAVPGPLVYTANGLRAGVFQAPQFQFIFPENLIMGSPQIPLTFQEFPFLAQGSGPYTPFNASCTPAPCTPATVGNLGQLNPWPSLSAPSSAPGTTLIQPPTPNAGSPQAVPSGATVNLDAHLSTDPQGMTMIYTWQQSAGPAVVWQNVNPGNPVWTFTAPTLPPTSAPVTLSFQLAVCNGYTCSGVVPVNVTVVSSTTAPSVTLSASQVTKLLPTTTVPPAAPNGTRVTLTANSTFGGLPCCTVTFLQTGGPAVLNLTPAGNTATFITPALAPGTPGPVVLTFTAKAAIAGNPATATATINVYIGVDTLTVVSVVYRQSKSQLKGAMTDSLPAGAATITMTPLDANGNAIGSNVVMLYDPTTNTYNVLQDITNPIPNQVRFTSNFGAVLLSPVTRIQ